MRQQKNYLSLAIPNTKLYRIRIDMDQNTFYYQSRKKKQIVFMPRKMKEDIIRIFNILKYRNRLQDWLLVSIDNKTGQEVTQIRRERHIFMRFNLPPAEAMACGCIVTIWNPILDLQKPYTTKSEQRSVPVTDFHSI